MKHYWLNKNNNDSIIIFFNGWGMDENPFTHIHSKNNDVITFFDYNTLEIKDELLDEINKYKTINIVAWSMGVWVANKISNKFNSINKSIAINGTLKPIDDNFGISPQIYDITLKNMSEQARKKFFKRMFTENKSFARFDSHSPKRDIQNQIDELAKLKNYIEHNDCFKNIFNSAIISMKDKIIPSQNQISFWQNESIAKIQTIDEGHCIFFNEWNCWEDILKHD